MAQLPREVPLPIPEGDEPLLTFETEADLTGASVAWISKSSKDVSDGSGVTIAGTVLDQGDPLTFGMFTVQLEDTVTALAVGHAWYRLVVTKGSHPLTIQYGPLVITNI